MLERPSGEGCWQLVRWRGGGSAGRRNSAEEVCERGCRQGATGDRHAQSPRACQLALRACLKASIASLLSKLLSLLRKEDFSPFAGMLSRDSTLDALPDHKVLKQMFRALNTVNCGHRAHERSRPSCVDRIYLHRAPRTSSTTCVTRPASPQPGSHEAYTATAATHCWPALHGAWNRNGLRPG